MMPIRRGDGTGLSVPGFSEVRKGDGTVLWSSGDDIPDSVVSRDDDNNGGTASDRLGVEISVSQDWPSIGATLSANVSGVSMAYLYDSDKNLLDSQSISASSAGESFTLDDVNLSASNNYYIMVDADGADYSWGNNNAPSLPYTSDDGNLEIVSGGTPGASASNPYNIVTVGDVGFA